MISNKDLLKLRSVLLFVIILNTFSYYPKQSTGISLFLWHWLYLEQILMIFKVFIDWLNSALIVCKCASTLQGKKNKLTSYYKIIHLFSLWLTLQIFSRLNQISVFPGLILKFFLGWKKILTELENFNLVCEAFS